MKDELSTKRPYEVPKLQLWGSVADLTQTGRTHPGGDQKGGSVMSRGR